MTPHQSELARWSLLPLRLVVGFGFVAHGLAKWGRGPAGFGRLLHQIGVPFPLLSAWTVTLLEVLGGVALLAGAFVAVASVPLFCSMLVAMVAIHWRYGFSAINTTGLTPQGPTFGPPGYEVNLLYMGALFALIVAGAGPISFDHWLAARRRHRGHANGRAGEQTSGARRKRSAR